MGGCCGGANNAAARERNPAAGRELLPTGDAGAPLQAALAVRVAGGAAPERPAPIDRFHGVTLVGWWKDCYARPECGAAVREIAAHGANAVCVVKTWYQDTAAGLPHAHADKTPVDDGVRSAIRQIHAAGMRAILKPHVDIRDGTFRGRIAPPSWPAWFDSYSALVVAHAALAAQEGAELFVIGTELESVTAGRLTPMWLDLIARVRAVYRGPITYAANWTERDVGFWGALDVIGVDAYWPCRDASAWVPIKRALGALAQRHHKPVLFTELGYLSRRGCRLAPYEFGRCGTARDAQGEEEQAAAFDDAYSAFAAEPWWAGALVWHAGAFETRERGGQHYSPFGKPAAQVLARYFGAGRAPGPASWRGELSASTIAR